MKDNIDRLLDAMEHPENYSDTEVELILADPEAREVYDVLHKTADASAHVPEINLDEEWQYFESKRVNDKSIILRCLPFLTTRNAAAVVFAIVGTIAVVGATIGMTYYFNVPKGMARTEQSVKQEETTLANTNVTPNDSISADEASLPETIVFKGENLERVLTDIAEYYGSSVKFNRDTEKSLQLYFEWNRSLSLREVVEQLNNFEQINITLTNKVLIVK